MNPMAPASAQIDDNLEDGWVFNRHAGRAGLKRARFRHPNNELRLELQRELRRRNA